MKKFALLLTLPILFLIENPLHSQCSDLIVSNFVRGNTQFITTAERNLIVRGDFTYQAGFVADARGLMLKVISIDGMQLERGDEIIFIDNTGHRESVVFTERGVVRQEGRMPHSTNFIPINAEMLNWLAGNRISTFFLRKRHENVMRKISLHSSRSAEFNQMAGCVRDIVDWDMVPSPAQPVATQQRQSPGSSTITDRESAKNISSGSSDGETVALQQELQSTRERLRAEIERERRRAYDVKQEIQDEIQSARRHRNEVIAGFEQEIEDERAKTHSEILRIRNERLERIASEKEQTGSIIDSLRRNVVTEMERTRDKIAELRKSTSEQIAQQRAKANRIIDSLRQSKATQQQLYATEVVQSRERAAERISQINSELERSLREAKDTAKVERERSAGEVVAARQSAANGIMEARQRAAREIAEARTRAELEIESIANEVAEARRRAADERAAIAESNQLDVTELRAMAEREREAILADVYSRRAERIEMEETHRTEMKRIRAEHYALVKNTQAAQDSQLLAMRDDFVRAVQRAEMRKAERIAKSVQEADSVLAIRELQVQAAKARKNQLIDSIQHTVVEERKRLAQAIQSWRQSHRKTLDSIRTEGKNQLESELAVLQERRTTIAERIAETDARLVALEADFKHKEDSLRSGYATRIAESRSISEARLKEIEERESGELAEITREFERQRELSKKEGESYRLQLAEEVRDARTRALEAVTEARRNAEEETQNLQTELEQVRLDNRMAVEDERLAGARKLREIRQENMALRTAMLDEREELATEHHQLMREERERIAGERAALVESHNEYQLAFHDSLQKLRQEHAEKIFAMRSLQASERENMLHTYEQERNSRSEKMEREREKFATELASFRQHRAMMKDSLRSEQEANIQQLLAEHRTTREEILDQIQRERNRANEEIETVQREQAMRVFEAKKQADSEIEAVKLRTASEIEALKSEFADRRRELDDLLIQVEQAELELKSLTESGDKD